MKGSELPHSLAELAKTNLAPQPRAPFAHQKELDRALDIFEEQKLRVKDFAEQKDDHGKVFSLTEVQADQLFVEKRRQQIKQRDLENGTNPEAEKYATILEAIIYELTENADWLGEEGSTIKTSDYDDIVNGIDEVFEFKKGKNDKGEYLGVAIDVTFATNEERGKIREKIRREEQNIRAGHLAEVKYFRSEWEEEFTTLKNIPRVVVGCDKISMEGLIRLWGNLNRVRQEAAGQGDRARFWELAKNHPLQFQILREIEMQLEYFASFAETDGKNELASEFRKRLAPIQHLLSTKRILDENKIPPEESLFERDRVFTQIRDALQGGLN